MERPYRQHAIGAFATRGEQRVDEVVGALRRLHQRGQRMQGAVRVPQGEGGVVRPAVRLVDGIVGSAITAVAVHEQRGAEQGVVQRRVEAGELCPVPVRLHRSQRVTPLPLRRRTQAIEVPARRLRIEVGDGVVLAHRRDGDFHQHRLPGGRGDIEGGDQLASLDLRALSRIFLAGRRKSLVGNVLLGVVQLVTREGSGEAHGEVQLPARRPAARFAKARDRAIRPHAQPRPRNLAGVVVHAGAQVQHDVARLACGKGVAVHAYARAGGELGAYLVVVQGDGVVAGLGRLGGVAEARGVSAAGLVGIAPFQLQFAGGGHQQQIAEIGMAGAGEVGVGEADDRGVVVAITRCPAVAVLAWLDARIRGQLDHAVGHGGARECVAFATGTNEGIHRVESGFPDVGGGGDHPIRDGEACACDPRQHEDLRAESLHPRTFWIG